MESKKEMHPSGLNIIQNSDGSYSFEWDPEDTRWSWLNGLTDEEVKFIIEDALQKNALGDGIDAD
jgi:hypothetical protein